MKMVFSRKGVDSGAGGCASPIVDGIPISLPIPTKKDGVSTTYRSLGLGDHFERATRKQRRSADERCHEDPMFGTGICAFGQVGIAQSHLANQGVGPGDVFLFFGLFSDEDGRNRHHRIFAYLRIAEVIPFGSEPRLNQSPGGLPRPHPHVIGSWKNNNTLYLGEGKRARHAHERLRLSADEKQISIWNVPPWLRAAGLSYHSAPERWLDNGRLRSAAKGQEFITPVATEAARAWLDETIEAIAR
jgi:hypothetical protein